MSYQKELRTGLRLLIMALVFLAMSCESDGDGGDCLGSTDNLITGCTDGCGTGMTPIGDGCIGSCLFGGDGDGCGTCAGEGCDMGCDMGCGDCGDVGPYSYNGDVVEGAVQVHVTNSLFHFVNQNLTDIIMVAAGDSLDIDENGWISICLDAESKPPSFGSFDTAICTEGHVAACNGGCQIRAKLGDVVLTPMNGNRLRIRVNIADIAGAIGITQATGVGRITCTVTLSRNSGAFYAQLDADFHRNAVDGNTELYIAGSSLQINRTGLGLSGCAISVLEAVGLVNTVINQLVSGIGAVTCRGCSSNADCGAGGNCQNGTCRDSSSRMCQGIQFGADARVDAGGLLQSFDPAAQGALGLRAFLGSYVMTNDGGLQLGARLGGNADPSSLCVPFRPSPVTPGTNSCRSGDNCAPLAKLNDQGTVINPATGDEEDFHIGVGVAMAGLNQVLWSAYSSGVLCLSVGGDTPGLEMLGTGLFSTFIGSLTSLTYGADQPLMLQLRPQQEPRVVFHEDVGQGAKLTVELPNLEIDFYTVVDERYARIFTLGADIALPLGIKASAGQVEIAIGDLAGVIDPDSVSVKNVEMVSESQVTSLVNNLPTLIGSLTGLLGDELIPPIDIPDISGITPKFVGPGLTIINEGNDPAALGLFLKLDIDPDGLGDLFGQMEPVIAQLDIDVRDPSDLRADIAARRAADQAFSYTDLMPSVVARMDIAGVDVAPENAEFAYSINNGPWSFWQRGPVLNVDSPVIAAEGKYDVRIAARVAGEAATGSTSHASFSFVNDYSAPTVTIEADGSLVRVIAEDRVYAKDELVMQYRTNSGEWSAKGPVEDIEIIEHLLEGPVVVDVVVGDPSGNARTVRRSFGEQVAPAASANTASNAQSAEGGCSTSQGNGGLLAVLGLLALVLFRRRPESTRVAASPHYIAIASLAVLLLGMGAAGCTSKDVPGACDPACGNSEVCIAGECVAMSCTDDDDCPLSDRCVDGVCMGDQLCDFADDCDYGHICKDGICKPSECSTHDECSHLSCGEGQLPFCDFDDYPTVEAGECVCESPVAIGRHGGWLQLLEVEEGGEVLAVAFSEQFGDVIFSEVGADGSLDWKFIDGVPEGPVVRPPSGVREGIQAAGDEAGRYVSAAVENVDGEPVVHVAYQYRTSGQSLSKLRYAQGTRGAAGWNWNFVDVFDYDVSGLFTEIVLTPPEVEGEEGGVLILFSTRDITVQPGEGLADQYFSEFQVAFAATRNPQAPEDFIVAELDTVENPIPCGGLCGARGFCVTDWNACGEAGSGCDDCASGQRCVRVEGGGSACMAATDATTGGATIVPRGIGLFASAAIDSNGVVHVAYYDQVHGNLMYVPLMVIGGEPTLTEAQRIVDGESGNNSTGDVGRWAKIALDASERPVIFYEDAGRAELRAAVINGNNASIVVLSTGRYYSAGGEEVQNNRVGSAIDAVAREDGGFDVYFQDTTNGIVRRIEWTNVGAAPTGHAHAIFGGDAAFERELFDTDAHDPIDEAERFVVSDAGAAGFYTQVLQSPQRTIVGAKNITSVQNAAQMRVQLVVHDLGGDNGDDDNNNEDDNNDDEGNDEP